MKKLLLFLSLVLFLFPVCVSAKEYDISEMYFKATLPDDWYVFTRDNIKGNETLKEFEISESYMSSMFTANKAYINAAPQDFGVEFFAIVINTSGINNLANYPDKMIENEVFDALNENLKTAKDVEMSLTKVNDYKYIKVSFYDPGSKKYIYKYYTVINSKGYNFQLQKDTKMNSEDEKILDEIVKTIEIKVLNSKESSKMQNEINKYNKKGSSIWGKVLIGAIVGAIAGAVGSIIGNKKKKEDNQNLDNNM